MKKVITIFVLLIVFFSAGVLALENTSSGITGKATSSDASLSIFVNAAPVIDIINPINGTYITQQELNLDYFSVGGTSIYYNLDNGANFSIFGNTTFNTTSGGHTLYLFSNNSIESTSKNVTFYVNSSALTIDYDSFQWGNSTNITKYPIEKIQNFSGLNLENPGYGRISFNKNINITDDENPNDLVVNISKNVNISYNSISVNTTALPNFDKSATLYIYNLTFTNPRILIDGEVCPSAICIEDSYENGTLKFNVTHFTTYSAEETPTSSSGNSGGSSGGGSGGSSSISQNKNSKFELEEDYVPIKIESGETVKSYFLIKNTGDEDIPIKISSENLQNFVNLSENNFTLKAGEEKAVIFSVSNMNNSAPNIYVGKFIVSSDDTNYTVLVSVEVESSKSLFDVNLNIVPGYENVRPGNNVAGEITLYNLGGTGKTDVAIQYEIIDSNGNIILIKNETVAVETSLDIIRSFNIPIDTLNGKYILYSKVYYDSDNKVASSSSEFNVQGSYYNIDEKTQLLSSIITLLFILLIFLKLLKVKKAGKPNRIRAFVRRKRKQEKPEKVFAKAFKKDGKHR